MPKTVIRERRSEDLKHYQLVAKEINKLLEPPIEISWNEAEMKESIFDAAMWIPESSLSDNAIAILRSINAQIGIEAEDDIEKVNNEENKEEDIKEEEQIKEECLEYRIGYNSDNDKCKECDKNKVKDCKRYTLAIKISEEIDKIEEMDNKEIEIEDKEESKIEEKIAEVFKKRGRGRPKKERIEEIDKIEEGTVKIPKKRGGPKKELETNLISTFVQSTIQLKRNAPEYKASVTRILELVCDNPDISVSEIMFLLQKEGYNTKMNTIYVKIGLIKKILNYLESIGKLK
jgi:hypothetical protein